MVKLKLQCTRQMRWISWCLVLIIGGTLGTSCVRGISAASKKDITARDDSRPPALMAVLNGASARDKYGRTGLMLAALTGDVNLASNLISRGADVDAVDGYNYSALFYALGRSDGKTITTPPCRVNISPKQKEVARLLIAKRANVNAIARDDFTPLCLAARCGDASLVQSLLDAGAKTNVMTTDHITSSNTTP